MHANKQNPKERLKQEIFVLVLVLKILEQVIHLCAINKPILLETMDFPEPVIGVAIEPKTQADIDKLGQLH